jgi:predicted RNase H-like HicB family nuclease
MTLKVVNGVEMLLENVERRPVTYVAHCVRSGDWWAVSVPGVRGAHSQAKRLDQVEPLVREAISLVLDVPEDSFDIRIEPVLVPDLAREVLRARQLRADADNLQREAGLATARAAVDLVKRGELTIRDAGQILGLSHQRVNQLIAKGA